MKRRIYEPEEEFEEDEQDEIQRVPDSEGYEYAYHYNYVSPAGDEDEDDEPEDQPRIRVKKGPPQRLLVMVQLLVCCTILLLTIFLKMFGGKAYNTAQGWYLEHINDTIIAQEKLDGVRDACVQFFLPRQPVVESSVSQPPESESSSVMFTTSAQSKAPVTLSVLLDNPVKESVVTSAFGERGGTVHRGLDLGAPEGSGITPALPGVVEDCGENSSYGKYVLIDHGGAVKTRYAHCSKLLVNTGDRVTYDKEIAQVGSTGDSDGPHLHLELLLGGVCYDPQPLLKAIDV